MNEPITTPRKDLMTKIFRPAILLLLVAILVMQVVSLTSTTTSADCKAAIETASAASADLPSLTSEYESGVYGRAENINQQILLANEFNFLALQQITLQQQALLLVTSACQ